MTPGPETCADLPATAPNLSSDSNVDSYRSDIDGLRAVAVLSVIGFHADNHLFPGGFVGVDVFFVISGFLISSIIFKALDNGRFSFATFYARRVRRIFPALILVLLAVWAVSWFVLVSDEYKLLGKNVVAGAGFVSNIFLWHQSGYFDAAAVLQPLLHLWSLGIEEQYYLVWPLAVFLVWKARLKRLKFILGVLVASFVLNLLTIALLSRETAFYLPHARFWELMVGSALAYVHLYRKDEFDAELMRKPSVLGGRPQIDNVQAWIGLALIVVSVAFLDRGAAFPGYWALLPTLGAFLLISAGPDAWINRSLLSSRVMVFIGLISYPLYLWHWPLLSFLHITSLQAPSVTAVIGAVGCAFVLAWITYYFVERPIRLSNNTSAARVTCTALLTLMLIVGGLGVLVVKKDGVPSRLSKNLRQLQEFRDDGTQWNAKREKTCAMTLWQNWKSFIPTCVDATPKDGPLLFLWGDSQTSDLYPGLHNLQATYKFRIAQYNAYLCPPMLHFRHPQFDYSVLRRPEDKDCPEINDWIFAKIKELHPDTVVMGAQYWFFKTTDTHAYVLQTVKELQGAGIKRIVIVGPEPEWKQPLPRSLFKYSVADLQHRIPDRMNYNLAETIIQADQNLRSWDLPHGVTYVSEIGMLCNEAGCRTSVEENGHTDLVSFDEHHLTLVGSQYVVDRIFPSLFDEPPTHIQP